MPAADAAKFVTFFDSLLDAMVANKADCAKMASATDALVDKNRALLLRMKALAAEGRSLPMRGTSRTTTPTSTPTARMYSSPDAR